MNIIQDIATKTITITFTAPDYELFTPVIVIQKVVGETKTFLKGEILTTNSYTYTPTIDGLYEIRVLFFSTNHTSDYYIHTPVGQPSIIYYSEDDGDTNVVKTIEQIKDITALEIDMGTIDEDNWVEYSGIYTSYVDATQVVLNEYIQDKDVYKNKQFQQLLDMSITIIKYLIVQSLFIEAGRIIDRLLPYTVNT